MKRLMKDGDYIAVIRPANPEKKVAMARQAAAEDWSHERFQATMNDDGPYTFVGYMSQDGKGILDASGEFVEALRAGDVFINEKALLKINKHSIFIQ